MGFLKLATVLLVAAAPAGAELTVEIRDHRDRPVDDAVVTAVPLSAEVALEPLPGGVMDQIDETFVPHVLVVPAGTPVQFPNHDDVRHHVYSFSEAKTFELPLYEGTPANPVTFDRTGVVTLGCNIHDWMRGYVYVTETPHAALSVAGAARLENLPQGRYRVEVWHPQMRSDENWSAEATVGGASNPTLRAELRLKPALRVRRAPKAGKDEY